MEKIVFIVDQDEYRGAEILTRYELSTGIEFFFPDTGHEFNPDKENQKKNAE